MGTGMSLCPGPEQHRGEGGREVRNEERGVMQKGEGGRDREREATPTQTIPSMGRCNSTSTQSYTCLHKL